MGDKMKDDVLRPRLSEAVKFLQLLRPGGPWLLIAIHPERGRPIAETCTTLSHGPGEPDGQGEDFILHHNVAHKGHGPLGIYYSVNPTRAPISKKATKKDIAAIEFVLADLDPNEDETSDAAKARYLAQLETFEPKPTAVVNSGNGLNVLWRLQDRIVLGELINGKFSAEDQAKIADVEARSQAIMVRLGSKAGTQNVDRVLRLPGTVNHPNAKKRKDGRVPCLSKLLWFNGASYPLDAFPPPSETGESESKKSEGKRSNSSRGKRHPRQKDHTGSGYGMWFFVNCRAKGMSYKEARKAILEDKAEAGEWAQRVDERQLKRAWAAAATGDNVAEINANHALVIIGDKAMIMKEGAKSISLLQPSAFKQWFANRYVQVGRKSVPLAKYWLEHPQRRQYEGIVFAPGERPAPPGHYNLWHGFAVEPRAGDCSKFLAHVHDNVCQGSERRFKWVIGFFAQLVQQPELKLGTSLALRGRQGVGKTIVGDVIGSLLGSHYVPVAEPRYITGRFNAHLNSCLLLHADEAFWAGDKSAEGKLKDLVTGLKHPIEYKGKEVIWVDNYVRLFVTGNHDWQVPAGFEERRFAVLDVGEEHMQDQPYFAAIEHEMKNGGREALLHYLLNFDLSTVDLRSIPKTRALLDQKIASLSPEQAWWLDILQRGQLPNASKKHGANFCTCDALFDSYIKHAEKQGVRRRAIETALGMSLRKLVPNIRISRPDAVELRRRPRLYTFPPLEDCRQQFSDLLQQYIRWEGGEEWEIAVVTGA
jgi:hypothetical protein